jgi:beta-galactosidase
MLRVKSQMKTTQYFQLAALALLFALLSNNSPAADSSSQSQVAADARVTENFDANWLFLKGDAPGAEQNQFDDSAWRKLDVPHDWSIEGPFAETNKAGGAGAFLPSGVGWYRKHFKLPPDDSGKCVIVEFDGVMANSDVWINGFHLGHRPYGYVSFSYEMTGHWNFGGDTVLAVRTDTSEQPASRWYAGAGIYRHVRLVVTDPVHLAENSVFVSTPEITSNQATVHVEMKVVNQSDARQDVYVLSAFHGPGEKLSDIDAVKTTGWFFKDVEARSTTKVRKLGHNPAPYASVAPSASATLSDDFVVEEPKLWNLDSPNLYQLVTRVYVATDFTNGFRRAKLVDEIITPFGIRDAHFEADTGFWLNRKNFKIKGACLHADGGAFGAAVPLAIWEERLKTLKSLGVNAIRTAHNPPAPEFLDLCDRMGLLVMDEMFDCWTVGKNSFDYHLYFDEWSKIDEHDAIVRDRNHPSVILYSVGNEIHDTPQAEKAKRILQGLVEVAHEADPTRPVTQALFRPNVSHDYDDGLADLLDVIGTNYRDNELLAAQRAKSSRKIIGTEQRQDRQTWLWLRDNPSHSGQFLWSGVDYLGESRRWPVVAAGSGLLDRTAAPKPMAFERQSWWSDQPMVFVARRTGATQTAPSDPGFTPLDRRQVLFADWTPKNLQPHDENVEVYSNCKEVELFLNGKSLGTKTINADASPRNWSVPFAPGILKAVARNGGKVVASDERQTAGKPAKIILSADKKKISADWNDASEVTAQVTDKNGIIIPMASDLISFHISGAGQIAAVDNADNSSHESFQADGRHAFQGRCVAFVKASAPSGKISLTATAPGLTSSSITIKAVK